MSLRIEYNERAISQAAMFLGDPQGLREVLDAIDRLADDPHPAGGSSATAATSSRSPASTTWPGGRHHRGAER